MKIQLTDFLNAEYLESATKDNPVTATIQNIELVPKEKLPFQSDRDRYEVYLLVDGESLKYLPNKTALRTLKSAFGSDSGNWSQKEIKLWAEEQMIQGRSKMVVYAKAV